MYVNRTKQCPHGKAKIRIGTIRPRAKLCSRGYFGHKQRMAAILGTALPVGRLLVMARRRSRRGAQLICTRDEALSARRENRENEKHNPWTEGLHS